MNMKSVLLLRIMLFAMASFISPYGFGQTALSYEYNGVRVGDSIRKQQVEYFYSGAEGQNAIWDISDLHFIKEYPVEFCCDSDSVMLYEVSPEQISKYSFSHDSLLLVGMEDPLKRVDYAQPIAMLVYPFEYGDSFSSHYSGKGRYCLTHLIEAEGDVNIEADGYGMLVLSENDTLKNVIRIHSTRTGSLYMHHENDSSEIARSRMKQEIEERFCWYAKGYRYPVLETLSTSYYSNMDLVSCVQSAFYLPLDEQHKLNDEKNDSIQHADSITNQPDIIHYNLTNNEGNIKLHYSLSENATITLMVCNHRGMTYRRIHFEKTAGDGYENNIDVSGLPADTYILYINVNGKVYSEKVNVR